jgi:hypothetical protein
MITPDEIRKKALAWWRPFLRSRLEGRPFFPRPIERIGRIGSDNLVSGYATHRAKHEQLRAASKDAKGHGYRIEYASRNFRRTGLQEIPVAVVFDTDEDYVRFIGRTTEWQRFNDVSAWLSDALPGIMPWMHEHCETLTGPIDWEGVVKVCAYFREVPRPGLFLRQLPVDVHTKFIEENDSLIGSIIESIVPGCVRDPHAKKFVERFHLRHDEPLVRLRHLDPASVVDADLRDVSIPLSAFRNLRPSTRNIVIAENRMNFLTLPALPSAMALWSGGGFQVSMLGGVEWVREQRVWYWGDIDEYGFQILHMLRSMLPGVRSLLMDATTYRDHQHLAAVGSRNRVDRLDALTPGEAELYRELRSNPSRNRLEQERIPQAYAEAVLKATIV